MQPNGSQCSTLITEGDDDVCHVCRRIDAMPKCQKQGCKGKVYGGNVLCPGCFGAENPTGFYFTMGRGFIPEHP